MVFPAPSLLALTFAGLAALQDARDREVSDFFWVVSIPALAILFPLFYGGFLVELVPAILIVPISYAVSRKGLLGEADPFALLVLALGFPQPLGVFPAYLLIFFLGLVCELGAFAVIIHGRSGKGAPSPFTYAVKKSELNVFWLPRLEDGSYAFDINDPRPFRQLIEEAKEKIKGEWVWATPILPLLPFLFASSLAVFALSLLARPAQASLTPFTA